MQMREQKKILLGITDVGVMHARSGEFDIDTRFRMAREAGVFDYVDKTPFVLDVPAYHAAIEKHAMPIRAGGFWYTLGRDEPLLEWHLNLAREFGAAVQNVQIMTHNAEGKVVTDEEIADIYLWAAELGEKVGVIPCFEVHVNMWSEHFGRVGRVAEMVEKRGIKFNMTLDHSHVIFKINNPKEQDVQGMRADIEFGRLELDPFRPGNICDYWISSGFVRHAHARAAAPGGSVNQWAAHPDGTPGRGIQYPFIQPNEGEWHSEWHEEALEPWKQVMRQLLRHHATQSDHEVLTISTEFIPAIDYGAGAKYSIFENNVACAKWIRQEWEKARLAVQ